MTEVGTLSNSFAKLPFYAEWQCGKLQGRAQKQTKSEASYDLSDFDKFWILRACVLICSQDNTHHFARLLGALNERVHKEVPGRQVVNT